MTMANSAQAKPITTVKYGAGTAQEAAAWVKYANVTKGRGITHWEIGNEVFGNVHYGSSYNWEYDTHADKSPCASVTNFTGSCSHRRDRPVARPTGLDSRCVPQRKRASSCGIAGGGPRQFDRAGRTAQVVSALW
ncbi:hypothetical protein ACFT38_28655 [Streptomyces sp. NPDC056975]|uniref:hypothetical protein n=1 Tax=Streptomyces sp. NPDC056975 TaxID=3345985 RepID=UPI00363D9CB9